MEFIKRWFRRPLEEKETTHYHPLPKYYMFNETGNILLCTSGHHIEGLDSYIKDSFIDVSVFLAAMTRALAMTKVGENEKLLSIYNYQAMKEMFAKSGMFIETNVERGYLTSRRVGETLGKRFVQTVLGRTFDDSSLGFTRGMFSGMRFQEETTRKSSSYQHGGHVFFICELLNGLPCTSVVLVKIEPVSGRGNFNANKDEFEPEDKGVNAYELGEYQEKGYGHCKTLRKWRFRKRSYLFVPPNYIKNASKRLNSAQLDDYDALVDSLSEKLRTAIKDDNQSP